MKEPLEFAIVMLALLVMLIMLGCLVLLLWHHPIKTLIFLVIVYFWVKREVKKIQEEIGF